MWKAILGVTVMLGAGVAMASTSTSTLPLITVYPSETELLLDRIAREIVDALPLAAELPDLEIARTGDGAVTTTPESDSESS